MPYCQGEVVPLPLAQNSLTQHWMQLKITPRQRPAMAISLIDFIWSYCYAGAWHKVVPHNVRRMQAGAILGKGREGRHGVGGQWA